MAATRLITMHQNKGKTIAQCLKDRTEYAKDDEKTEEGRYISSYACNPEIADKEFLAAREEYLRSHRKPNGEIIAYQIRQSFKPGEVSPEEANEIGYELAKSFTKGNHAFIVATHTDRQHIHNHIIFNSVTLDCDRKFKNFFLSSFVIQRISDGLCLQHGLSVIKPRPYKERDNKGYHRESLRSQVQADIDKVLSTNPQSFERFLFLLEEEDYQIKKGKHLAIKGRELKRFVRFDSLAGGYREQDLRQLFEDGKQSERKAPARSQDKFDMLIDIQKKIAEGKGAGYERWAKIYNVKQISKTPLFLKEHDVRDYATLEQRAASASASFNELTDTIKACDARIAELTSIRKQILTYAKTKDVYVAYRKSGYSEKFFEEHREAITLHKAAKKFFSEMDGKIPKLKEISAEYDELLAKKKAAYSKYKEAKQERNDFVTAKKNIDTFLGYDMEHEQKRDRRRTR